MKLFQIEEPDGAPVDPDAPGAAIGIDVGAAEAEVAVAVGGNAVVLADREGFEQNLPVPSAMAAAAEWQRLFEGARLRAERVLAQPVTHAVIVLGAAAEPALVEKLTSAAGAAELACPSQAEEALSPRSKRSSAVRRPGSEAGAALVGHRSWRVSSPSSTPSVTCSARRGPAFCGSMPTARSR